MRRLKAFLFERRVLYGMYVVFLGLICLTTFLRREFCTDLG
jgi:hypothetical protein